MTIKTTGRNTLTVEKIPFENLISFLSSLKTMKEHTTIDLVILPDGSEDKLTARNINPDWISYNKATDSIVVASPSYHYEIQKPRTSVEHNHMVMPDDGWESHTYQCRVSNQTFILRVVIYDTELKAIA